VFAQAEQQPVPTPANFARPAVVPAQPQGGVDYSSVSRPVSDGWYAKRRDQAQAVLGSEQTPESTVPQSHPLTPDAAAADRSTAPPAAGQALPPAMHRTAIEAEPLTPAAAPSPQATKSGSNVVLEWNRPADQPYRAGPIAH
jgi:hypothetical protein